MSSPLQAWPTSKPRPGDLQRHSQGLSRPLYAISASLFREAPLNGLTGQSAPEPSCEGLKSRSTPGRSRARRRREPPGSRPT